MHADPAALPDAKYPPLTRRERQVLRWVDAARRRQEGRRRLQLRRELPHLLQDTVIGPGADVFGGSTITFGPGVRIGKDARLQVIERSGGQTFDASIHLGARVSMEDRVHLGAIGRLVLGDDVLVASGVLITDHVHGYADMGAPVAAQPLSGGGLSIGAGSHIGEAACVLGPITIGRHCVVGAHAIVLSDVPDHSVVVGAPARVVRRYDPSAGEWIRAR